LIVPVTHEPGNGIEHHYYEWDSQVIPWRCRLRLFRRGPGRLEVIIADRHRRPLAAYWSPDLTSLFQSACNRLGLDPADVVFFNVGDFAGLECIARRQAGPCVIHWVDTSRRDVERLVGRPIAWDGPTLW
jgi:hypothetical protein